MCEFVLPHLQLYIQCYLEICMILTDSRTKQALFWKAVNMFFFCDYYRQCFIFCVGTFMLLNSLSINIISLYYVLLICPNSTQHIHSLCSIVLTFQIFLFILHWQRWALFLLLTFNHGWVAILNLELTAIWVCTLRLGLTTIYIIRFCLFMLSTWYVYTVSNGIILIMDSRELFCSTQTQFDCHQHINN